MKRKKLRFESSKLKSTLCLRLLYKQAHKTVPTPKKTALGTRCSQRHEHPVARRSLRLSGQGSAGTVITTIPATTSSLSLKIFGARRSTVTGLTGDSFDEVSNPLPLQLGAESPHTAATSSSTTLSNGVLELHGPRDFLLWEGPQGHATSRASRSRKLKE